jgi:NADPH-dependent glutamate synthase beta subunit-like oxidoreductase
MHIPDYIQAITDRNYKDSANIIYENNPLPEMCGKVCTRQCETACVYHNRGEAVAIRWLKRFTTEQFSDFKDIINAEIKPLNGKKVGIIGAGPAGLTAGYYLRLRGYEVTIYEALSKAGGMTMAGIPKYRFPLDSLDKQINYMEEMGVKINYNTRVGTDIQFDEIMDTYDAVFIGIGFHKPYSMGLKGEQEAVKGVIPAVDLLRRVNFDEKVDVGKSVVVIGGGNVAIDGARVSKRLGDIDVTILYRRRVQDMPADWEEIEGAEDEGINIIPQAIPEEVILDKNGKVTAIKYSLAEMVSDAKGGRPRPKKIEGSEKTLKVDTVIGAIGQEADYSFLPDKYLIKTENEEEKKNSNNQKLDTFWGRILVHGYNETTMKKVFSGGDMVNRTADAISAIADGLNAVKGIDLFLQGKETIVNHSVKKSDLNKNKLIDEHYKMKHENGKLVAVKFDLSGKMIPDSVVIAKDPDVVRAQNIESKKEKAVKAQNIEPQKEEHKQKKTKKKPKKKK